MRRTGGAAISRQAVWVPLAAGALVLAVPACGFMGSGSGFPAPPRNPPVVSPVTLSTDGRVITVRAAKPCGQRPLLIARSNAWRVTLRLVNRDVSDCHVEAVGVTAVSVTLPAPLGNRQLLQATTGKPISWQIVSPSPRPRDGRRSSHPPLRDYAASHSRASF